jgi:hypothetical protein
MSNQPINDGGPAFPSVDYSEPIGSIGPQLTIKGGATLRDYFAAAALQGILADGGGASWDDDAKNAFKAADAMLKAREEAK